MAEQVAFHLAKQIIEGQLQPKEHVQESRLVKEFQVSRSSVREALLIMVCWHLIEIHSNRNRGAIVCAINIQDTPFRLYSVLHGSGVKVTRYKDGKE